MKTTENNQIPCAVLKTGETSVIGHTAFAAFVFALGTAPASAADSWETVDFSKPASLSAIGHSIGVAADGTTLFSVGSQRYDDFPAPSQQ